MNFIVKRHVAETQEVSSEMVLHAASCRSSYDIRKYFI